MNKVDVGLSNPLVLQAPMRTAWVNSHTLQLKAGVILTDEALQWSIICLKDSQESLARITPFEFEPQGYVVDLDGCVISPGLLPRVLKHLSSLTPIVELRLAFIPLWDGDSAIVASFVSELLRANRDTLKRVRLCQSASYTDQLEPLLQSGAPLLEFVSFHSPALHEECFYEHFPDSAVMQRLLDACPMLNTLECDRIASKSVPLECHYDTVLPPDIPTKFDMSMLVPRDKEFPLDVCGDYAWPVLKSVLPIVQVRSGKIVCLCDEEHLARSASDADSLVEMRPYMFLPQSPTRPLERQQIWGKDHEISVVATRMLRWDHHMLHFKAPEIDSRLSSIGAIQRSVFPTPSQPSAPYGALHHGPFPTIQPAPFPAAQSGSTSVANQGGFPTAHQGGFGAAHRGPFPAAQPVPFPTTAFPGRAHQGGFQAVQQFGSLIAQQGGFGNPSMW